MAVVTFSVDLIMLAVVAALTGAVVMSKIISPQVLVITRSTARQIIFTKKPGKS